MDEKYRLVFRGEVLDGQHRAVVKRRLAEALTLKEGQLEKLFSGGSVVLKRGADAKLAARYQALFKKAGARLRVFAEETAASPAPSAQAAAMEPQASAATEAAPPAAAAASFTLVDPAELDKLVAQEAARVVEISAPDFSLAELGAQLGDPRNVEILELPDIELTLAELGADLLEERPEVEPVRVVDASFDLAEVGAVLGPETERPVPPAPDTSHLAVVEEA